MGPFLRSSFVRYHNFLGWVLVLVLFLCIFGFTQGLWVISIHFVAAFHGYSIITQQPLFSFVRAMQVGWYLTINTRIEILVDHLHITRDIFWSRLAAMSFLCFVFGF